MLLKNLFPIILNEKNIVSYMSVRHSQFLENSNILIYEYLLNVLKYFSRLSNVIDVLI